MLTGMASGVQDLAPPPPLPRSQWQRWRPWAIVATVVVLLLGLVGWIVLTRVDFGNPTRRVASPTGEYEVVEYEFSAMIDTGWNLAIERVDGDGRQWFWRSVEGPAPENIRFTGPTSVEVTIERGAGRYEIDFDPDSLEPSRRFCLNTEYCQDDPWNDYTRD